MNLLVEGGSLPIWVNRVAGICASRGHEIVVFANHGHFFRCKSVRKENINYIYTPTGLNRLLNKISDAVFGLSAFTGKIKNDLPGFSSVWQNLGYAIDVGRRSRLLECDVIHVMNYSQYPPVIRKLNPNCRICLHMHCEWLTQLNYRIIENRLSAVDLIIGVSDHITNKIAERFPQFKNRCITVPNAAVLKDESDRANEQPYYVLFIGRVSPEKGVHLLVRAFHKVLKRFPQAQLHIVGGIGSAPLEYLVGLSDEPYVRNLRVYYENEKASAVSGFEQTRPVKVGVTR